MREQRTNDAHMVSVVVRGRWRICTVTTDMVAQKLAAIVRWRMEIVQMYGFLNFYA